MIYYKPLKDTFMRDVYFINRESIGYFMEFYEKDEKDNCKIIPDIIQESIHENYNNMIRSCFEI